MSSSAADYEYEYALPLSSSSHHNARKRSSSWWMVPPPIDDHGSHTSDADDANAPHGNADADAITNADTTAKRMKLHHDAHHDSAFQSSAQCDSNFVTHRTPPPVRSRRGGYNRFRGVYDSGTSTSSGRGTGSSIRFGLRRPPTLRFSPKSVDPGSIVIPFPDLNGEADEDSDQENAGRHNNYNNRYQPVRPLPLRVRIHADIDTIPPVMLFQEE